MDMDGQVCTVAAADRADQFGAAERRLLVTMGGIPW